MLLWVFNILLLLQSALQSLWFWPAQLSSSILSRKVFTECRCQRHVKPPTWRTNDQNVPTPATRRPSSLKRRKRAPAAEGGSMGEKLPRIVPKVATSTSLLGYFTCRKLTTWDRRLYFPSAERRAGDFFVRKIRRLRPGLNPRTWLPKTSTLTPRPPKPLGV